jgi:2-desacetyl-2-hydroxyethyl bacteriochlorophyllide A dehydrogenase
VSYSLPEWGQAVIATAPRKIVFDRVRLPEPTPNDVVVRVLHSWISNGTEGSFVRGERIAGDTPRTSADPLPFPHSPGYQKVGIVEWAGSNVTEVQPGDLVFASVSKVEGLFFSYAGHVSPAVTDRSNVWKLPAGVDPVAASGLVLTQVGFNIGTRPPLDPGDSVIVLGDGMVGQWAAQTYQYRGAKVLLAGRHDERLDLLDLNPGDRTVNTKSENLLTIAREWAPGGVQVVADTVGSVASLEALYPAMKRGAHMVSAGFCGEDGLIDIQKMRNREISLHAPSGWTRERIDETMALLAAGKLDTLSLITHRFPVADAAAAFDLILSRREPVLGVILDWEA